MLYKARYASADFTIANYLCFPAVTFPLHPGEFTESHKHNPNNYPSETENINPLLTRLVRPYDYGH